MAMTVLNNSGTMAALGQLKKNDTTLGKQLKKVASGMKINSAGDAAAEYSISERMRVRLRALDQNSENVQNGASLLHVAEGGIQRQIDIMRTIKQKVIDANNDTNTDADRATIQKEINQGYDQIEDIAYETTYNGKRILAGDAVRTTIDAWEAKSLAETVSGCADMNVIADKYEMTGDAKLTGAPAKYDQLSGYQCNPASVLGIQSEPLTGGVNCKVEILDIASSMAKASDLVGKGLSMHVVNPFVKNSGVDYAYVFVDAKNPSTYTDTTKAAGKTRKIAIDTSGSMKAAYTALARAMAKDAKAEVSNIGPYGFRMSMGSDVQEFQIADATSSDVTDASGNVVSHGIQGLGAAVTTAQAFVKPEQATAYIDLSAYYKKYDPSVCEQLIDDLTSDEDDHFGKALKVADRVFEFYDSADTFFELNGVQKIPGSIMVDLNEVRKEVVNGHRSVAYAFANHMVLNVSSDDFNAVYDSKGSDVEKLQIHPPTHWGNDIRTYDFEAYNNNPNYMVTGWEATMSSYDIDYRAWFAGHSMGDSLASYLNDKGFRFYDDDTDSKWWNITFTDWSTEEKIGERPASGTETQDITTMVVDVRNVRSAEELVEEIVKQTKDKMPDHFRWSKDAPRGLLTLYDTQHDAAATDHQKIADGPYDNVVVAKRNLMVEEVHIQDTDRGSQNTVVEIPKTSLDHIFGFAPGTIDVKETYTVMTREMRDRLLGFARDDRRGTPESLGYLDRAINYLLDANTLVGAQTTRMAYDHANIVTAAESTQASESTIRDSDMAKEMTNYTKANVLAQSAQAMLTQANSNAGNVVSLLQ